MNSNASIVLAAAAMISAGIVVWAINYGVGRIDRLEDWMQTSITTMATLAEKVATIDRRVDRLETR